MTIPDGMTVITGISGSGKSSLVYDTLYKEATDRLFDVFSTHDRNTFSSNTKVESITGIKPVIGIKQNIKNRNPHSTLATASGIHVLLRILYARYGIQHCPNCGTSFKLYSKDSIVKGLEDLSKKSSLEVYVCLLNKVKGSHTTLLKKLHQDFSGFDFLIDGEVSLATRLQANEYHTISIKISEKENNFTLEDCRNIISLAESFGVGFIILKNKDSEKQYRIPFKRICSECNSIIEKIEPAMFNKSCPYCKGNGCSKCSGTGLYPSVVKITWKQLTFQQILNLSVSDFTSLITKDSVIPSSALELKEELIKKSCSLLNLGLGYLQLNRPSPTLSRGEYQRLQIAKIMVNDITDVLYILDEPTTGLHPSEVTEVMDKISELDGDIIYIEHDDTAISYADTCIELGIGAGKNGGEIVFQGKPESYIKKMNTTIPPHSKCSPQEFISFHGANSRNVEDVSIDIPVGCATVICGVSGSGKSTLINEVVVPSLQKRRNINCSRVTGKFLNTLVVNQDPVGKNTRSISLTYMNLFDEIRKIFSYYTNKPISLFSFNSKEGACCQCSGTGTIEIKMRYQDAYSITCPVCKGNRFSLATEQESISINNVEYSITDFMQFNTEDLLAIIKNDEDFFREANAYHKLFKGLTALNDVGLNYLCLGQSTSSLSGGETQRLKIARLLSEDTTPSQLLVFDEPTSGLHKMDIEKILCIFDNLKSKGVTLLIVEHNIDVIEYADWLIEIGPDSGPNGGKLMFQGTVSDIYNHQTKTAHVLKNRNTLCKTDSKAKQKSRANKDILISNAYANNLQHISLSIPKNAMTVVTGVSGSGKSTLVWEIIEAEAKRNYLETLSVYERYSINETKNSFVDSISGVGLICSVESDKWKYNPRSTVGTVTNLYSHLAVMYAYVGEISCPHCGSTEMKHEVDSWICPHCHNKVEKPRQEDFIKSNYTGACTSCQGVGTIQKLNIDKIIIAPDKPLLNGAMKSHGYFPKGFLSKSGSSGRYFLEAFAQKYKFDLYATPWNDIDENVRRKFIMGDNEPLTIHFKSSQGREYTQILPFPGFKGWLDDWDLGGTFTDHVECPLCKGSGLKSELNKIMIQGLSIHEACSLPIDELSVFVKNIETKKKEYPFLSKTLKKIQQKCDFLIRTGMSYINLNRFSATLSAGEAQRMQLTTLLSNEMSGLTVLLDEPTRGLHQSEIEPLIHLLKKLCTLGNTLIVIEHETTFMECADNIIEIGKGAGKLGGEIIASGNLKHIDGMENLTSKWLRKPYPNIPETRRPVLAYVEIVNATENNLKIKKAEIPLNNLTGICGVSGSGKSTLIVDTIAHAHIKTKQNTSVAYEPMIIGKYHSITGMQKNVVLIDQSKTDISNLFTFLGIDKILQKIYLEDETAVSLHLSQSAYKKTCTECNGKGYQKISMEFMSPSYVTCEVCNGTGFSHEAQQVKIKGYSYPELFNLNVEELYNLWKENKKIEQKLKILLEIGLGYLIVGQKPHTFSGGEIQRLKLAKGLQNKKQKDTLYILDEPTSGLHNEDINKLMIILNRLVDNGCSVWVIEHNLNLLLQCDYLIELGLGGGKYGGNIVATGTPEEVSCMNTETGKILKRILT